MAVPNLPFYMTAANMEFVKTASGWCSATLAAANIPKPRWLSELAGRSSSTHTVVFVAYGQEVVAGGGFGGSFSPATLGPYTIDYISTDSLAPTHFTVATSSLLPAGQTLTVTIPGFGTGSGQRDPNYTLSFLAIFGGDVNAYLKTKVGQSLQLSMTLS